MNSALQVTTERVDDIPVLFFLLHQQLGIGSALDSLLARHGNWSGLSAGQTLEVWLTHILSEHNHFMTQVQDWANQRAETLAQLLQQPLRPTDLTDDRLGELTRFLSRDEVWQPLEAQVNQHMIRAYHLPTRRVRTDSTPVSLDARSEVAWLFRRGRSKDYRPDLPQFKVMLAALDPLGAPLAADVVPGNAADDPLYLPILQRLWATLPEPGVLFIGDCKMAALETRAEVQAHQHFYLMPLAHVGKVPEQLANWVEAAVSGQVPLVTWYAEDRTTVVGQAYEFRREQTRLAAAGVAAVSWTERVLVVRSASQVQAGQRGLTQRLQRAESALHALTPPRGRGQRQFTETAPLRAAVDAILDRYDLRGLLTVAVQAQVEQKTVRGYRGQPGRTAERRRYQVRVWRNQAALETYERALGWRAYVTNSSAADLPLPDAVQVYGDEWLIERDMARLKGRPLSLAPVWVTREDHALGWTRVLTLALRVLAVAEYHVRQQLAQQQQALSGLYPGQPQRSTARPTTERLLKAFGNITLTILQHGKQVQRHLTPLSHLQKEILSLLGCPRDLYQQLVHDSG